jgi:hypothetical protein
LHRLFRFTDQLPPAAIGFTASLPAPSNGTQQTAQPILIANHGGGNVAFDLS